MLVQSRMTRKEFKNHRKVLSKKMMRRNFPLFLSMQIIYEDNLKRYLKKEKEPDELVVKELKVQEEFVKKLRVIYEKEFPGIPLSENNIDTEKCVDKKFSKSVYPILSWYKRRSKMHEILRSKKIDLAYVY